MRKRKAILPCLAALLLVLSVLPAGVLAAQPEEPTGTVTFVADGEVYATVRVPTGENLGNMPCVPEKAGYTGVWDKTVDTVNGDITVAAVYTLISPSSPNTQSPLWLAPPILVLSVLLAVIVVSKKHDF